MAKKLGTDLEKGIKSDSMASRQEHFGYTYVAPPPPESIFGAPPLVYASWRDCWESARGLPARHTRLPALPSLPAPGAS
jgi:hypothetical protein